MPAIESLTVRQLRALLVLDRERHFGRAATGMGVSQPSLSQMIRRIEGELGTALFKRTPGIEPTWAGRRFLPQVSRALDRLERGLGEIERARQGHTGRLIVSFASSAMISPFPDILRAFRGDFPDVDIQLRRTSSAAIPDGLEVDDHVGIGRFGRLPPDTRSETIVDEPFSVALPADHRLAARQSIDLGALDGERLIHFPRSESPALHDDLLAAYRDAGVAPNIVLEAQEWITIVGLVAAGLGVSLVPAGFESVAWGRVVYRPLSPPTPRSVVAACHPSTAESPVVGQFMKAVRASRQESG